MSIPEILVGSGAIAILASVIGGGLKANNFEVPLLESMKRQILLGIAGLALLALGLFSTRVEDSRDNRPAPAEAQKAEPRMPADGEDLGGNSLMPEAEPKTASRSSESQEAAAAPVANRPHSRTADRREGQESTSSSPPSNNYSLDRTDIFFRFSDIKRPRVPTMALTFLNSSGKQLEYRIRNAYITIDGNPLSVNFSLQWIELEPGASIAPEMPIRDGGITLQVGSIIDVAYAIDIRAHDNAPVERRYEKIRKVVTGISSEVHTSTDQQMMLRSVMLPPDLGAP